jgi:hypothetical protein
VITCLLLAVSTEYERVKWDHYIFGLIGRLNSLQRESKFTKPVAIHYEKRFVYIYRYIYKMGVKLGHSH